MNEEILVAINTVLGQFLNAGSSQAADIAVDLGIF
ncbi:hypothetical protein CCICO_01040 [Corynebacterium ciconiae DSM 44920]|nr:hypothetical protein CCICO_01040 [Corynebacterium ciconiae DSM 44920]